MLIIYLGDGADPSKPVCKKAKVKRKEAKLLKQQHQTSVQSNVDLPAQVCKNKVTVLLYQMSFNVRIFFFFFFN